MPDEATTVEIRPTDIAAPVQPGSAQSPGPVQIGTANTSEPAKIAPASIREPGHIRPATTGASSEVRPHMRFVHGLRRPANWLQLVRFGVVGGIGFAVNLAVYAVCVRALGIDYHIAAVAAWVVAVLNNFVLNRHWTFDAGDGRARFQAVRFVVVSLVAFGFSLILLTLLVEAAGVPKVPAQALAVAASMPLNFLGNKLWSFRAEATAGL
jgi:putative flippase GtrA